jgi:cytochrome c biogenesis protein CcmG/thiol:disulfide interchange protein DsbE
MAINPTETIPQEAPAARTRPRWGRILVWAGVLALLALLALGLLKPNIGFTKSVGDRVPNFTLTTFEGQQIALSELQGKVVLINFWASWCKPCEAEAADLEAAWRYYQPRGDVVFLGVDWTDTDTAAKGYLEKFDITYPNGPDLGTRISQSFRTTGVPETYIVDRSGALAYVKISPFASLEEIKSAIDPLLQP